MRILVIHNRYQIRGGEDTVFEAESEMLKKNGNIVETVVFENKECESINDRIMYFIRSVFNIKSYDQISKKITMFQPDVIHIHNLFYTASPSIIYAARKRNVPIVMTVHNFRLLCPSALFLRNGRPCEICRQMKFPWPAIIYRCFKRAFITSIGLAVLLFIHNIIGTWKHIRKVIFLTEFQKSKFISSSLKFSPLKICVKPNLVNFNNKERKEQNVSFYANTKYFLFAGRLTEEKGINVLLNAWKGSSSSLYIAGEGPLLNEVTSHASNNKNIIYVGCKLDLSELMANAQALIVPSIWYEIFPMVILEAFSVGTTVIASRIGSLITLVNNEIDGLLFTPGDSVDLKNAVNRISEDNKLRERLKRGVDETYLKKYSPEISYKKLIEIYENL